ncbi:MULTISPECIES: LexA family transcriptional regulator [Afifella]|uniref:LexA family transcriptional regulator n=1 Tax=Afifella TaxID=643217 RepID=UPI000FE3CAAB|nr:LexA family transcriptional regulator [Afifella aestuarii]
MHDAKCDMSRMSSGPSGKSDRLRQARQDAGYATGSDAARAFGWAISTYLGHENGDRGFSSATAERYARAFRVSAAWLLTGEMAPARNHLRVPLVGYVGGGERVVPIDDHEKGASLETIDLDFADFDPVAVRVRGSSMAPAYRNGDVLVCSRVEGADIERALNRDCVVMTVDGEGYLKILRPGDKPGTYRLRSYNPAFEDIENVALAWVAPVKMRLIS